MTNTNESLIDPEQAKQSLPKHNGVIKGSTIRIKIRFNIKLWRIQAGELTLIYIMKVTHIFKIYPFEILTYG